MISVIGLVFSLFGCWEIGQKNYFNLMGFASIIPVIFFSDWHNSLYNFFQGPSIRGELLVGLLFSLVLLYKNISAVFKYWVFVSVLLIVTCFFIVSEGRVIFSDDHTSVFYRLTLLKENFPRIPFYNPMWNFGIEARDFFSTGILNLFFIGFPLIKFFKIEDIYNILVVGIAFVLVPLSVYLGAILLKSEKKEALIAAAFSLSLSIIWYRWVLKYGAMGFITSVALIPFNFCFLYKLLTESVEIKFRSLIFFIITFSLMIFWTPTAFVILPFVVLVLMNFKIIISNKKLIRVVLIIALLNLPWIVLWLKVANVFHFVTASTKSEIAASNKTVEIREGQGEGDTQSEIKKTEKINKPTDRRKGSGKDKTINLKSFTKGLKNFAINSNPLLLFLGIPGIFLFQSKQAKLLFASAAIWLLFLGIIVAPYKPHLELERMLLILLVLLCIPTGIFFSRLIDFSFKSKNIFSKVIVGLNCSYFFLGSFVSTSIIYNRSLENYYFTDDTVLQLVKGINENADQGRVLFTGFVLHELNHGHLAPLAYFTRKNFVASSPVHNTWWYTDVIPDYYKENNSVEEYFNIVNASIVIAHEEFWRGFFNSQPEKYRYIDEYGKFKLYKRINYQSNYFYQGEGSLEQENNNSLVVKLKTSDAVIKFNHYDFLTASACEMSPFQLDSGIALISLKNCPLQTEIKIKAVSAIQRIID